jgi:pimeloyl-ACP methyl ester carboxylesterase
MLGIPTIFYKLLVIGILVYFGLGLLLFLLQRKFVYYPDFPVRRNFGDCPELRSVERVSYKDARFYYKHIGESVVVMYNGNAGNSCDRAIFAEVFEKIGYSYLLVEYPGYANDSTGGPSKKRILQSVGTVQEFLGKKKFLKVALVGESLGVGVAAYHASTDAVERLILISPHYELSDMAGWMGRIYPISLLMRENYTPGLWLKDVKASMLFVYASDDEIIPRWSMEKLYNSIPGQKTQVEISGATHNTMYEHPEFFTAIEKFLK